MKKIFSIIVLSVMTLSLSSFTSVSSNNFKSVEEAEFFSCRSEAEDFREFMDGHNGRSGAYWALEYYETFFNQSIQLFIKLPILGSFVSVLLNEKLNYIFAFF
ncbi:hypothetical protein [Psychroflexus tropicus]|uniref:hypothetical protein n=1 Tax=Psychroflexus tropicus TaxID=197345 RepID=UPI00039AC465|nr:hypothetical protein [Psychroflexus tropicus]